MRLINANHKKKEMIIYTPAEKKIEGETEPKKPSTLSQYKSRNLPKVSLQCICEKSSDIC